MIRKTIRFNKKFVRALNLWKKISLVCSHCFSKKTVLAFRPERINTPHPIHSKRAQESFINQLSHCKGYKIIIKAQLTNH